MVAAGPLASWMIEWSPRLACASKKRALVDEQTVEHLAELPELAITPDLVALLTTPPATTASTLAAAISEGRLAVSHRAVLVNLIARMQPASLPEVAIALGRVNPSLPSIGLAFALADLARLRHHMLTELELHE